ncbi:IclR family transcriptional regulator [Ottowia thiooxydans]|uniref:IclR family transcriptional regulator n=1 Tax=Ottowia thiooxydans TaxID=219182 RepID=UPI0004177400|nr:IclR family transcriptional regulator [Ottowia thiooxydans]
MVFQLLDKLMFARGPIGITEMAELLNEPKPRVYRHLASLRQLGIVEQDSQTEKYRLGARLVVYGQAASEQFDLRAIADPYLTRLRDATGESAMVSIATNGTALVIATADSLNNVCISVKPGNRVHAHCTAQGRIVLAFTEESALNQVAASEMRKFNASTICTSTNLRQRVALVKERMWDVAEGEITPGISAIAAPVFRNENTLAGTIGIVGASVNIPADPPIALVREVQKIAAEMSERLNNHSYSAVFSKTREGRRRS